jgi:hypothetical protein
MLAFNLAIFFHNLAGAEVVFSARNAQCALDFSGRVGELREQTDLSRHLAVTLHKGDLSCRLLIVEDEDVEAPEEALVEVRLVHLRDQLEVLVLQTRFRFEEISLKPVAEQAPAALAAPERPN